MKTKFFVSCLLVWTSVNVAAAIGKGDGWEGGVVWYSTPNTTNAAWVGVRDDALQGLMDGGVPFDSFVPIKSGNRTAATLLPGGGGFQVRAGLVLTTVLPFYPSNVFYKISSSDPENHFRFEGTFSGLSVSRWGVGVNNGFLYTNGNPLITTLYAAGVANGFLSSGAEDTERIAGFIEANRPWVVTATYGIIGTDIIVKGELPFNFPPPTFRLKVINGRPKLLIFGASGTLDIRRSDSSTLPWENWEKLQWVFQPNADVQELSVPVPWPKGFFSARWFPAQ
jgi:hypothetical protein